MIIFKISNGFYQNISSLYKKSQLFYIMHRAWHLKIQIKARLFIMVFICTNSCTKYDYVGMFCINPQCKYACNDILQTFEDITINRHNDIYVSFHTFHIMINSNDLSSQRSTCWITSWLKLIGSPNGFTGCMHNEVSS